MKKFISFEGGEGAGKTTQIKKLSKCLQKNNIDFFLTREPGGNNISEKIRKLILDKQNLFLPESELLLICAARHEHLKKTILPNLEKKIVICDRFVHSTICYQVLMNKIPLKIFKYLHKNFSQNLFPDITFYLDINPEIGVRRAKKKNKFELKKISFHKNIRKYYLKLSQNENKIIKIDASMTKNNIHKEIIEKLNELNFFGKKINEFK